MSFFIYLRSAVFLCVGWIINMIFGTVFLPFALLSVNVARKISVLWAWCVVFFLKLVCGIKYRVEGVKNLPQLKAGERLIIVSKHQSVWETMFFTMYFKCPAFILKRELLWVPFFGLYLLLVKMIVIRRNQGAGAIRSLMRQILNLKDKKRPIIIFPEGSRVPSGKRVSLRPGIVFLVKNIPGAVILPISLNSGEHWPKTSWLKKPGVINIKLMLPIRNGDKRKNLLSELEEKINDL